MDITVHTFNVWVGFCRGVPDVVFVFPNKDEAIASMNGMIVDEMRNGDDPRPEFNTSDVQWQYVYDYAREWWESRHQYGNGYMTWVIRFDKSRVYDRKSGIQPI